MQVLIGILLVYLAVSVATLALLFWRNRRMLRNMTPHQRALAKATLSANPAIPWRDLCLAAAIWPLVLLILAIEFVDRRF